MQPARSKQEYSKYRFVRTDRFTVKTRKMSGKRMIEKTLNWH
nr:MAG TPA: hypothetical protein [Bacteriophage sp.]